MPLFRFGQEVLVGSFLSSFLGRAKEREREEEREIGRGREREGGRAREEEGKRGGGERKIAAWRGRLAPFWIEAF